VSSARSWRRIALLGVEIDAVREAQCVEHVLQELAAGRGGWVVTPNLDHLRRLVNEQSYRELCAGADLFVADGMPLVWASRLQGTPLPERVAGSDLITSLTQGAARAHRSIFLLGGDPGTAEAAGRILVQRNPGLVVRGTACPAPGFERDELALRALRTQLAEAQPDIVYVALGSPKQERLIVELRQLLPRAWWLGVGISFSFVTGDVKRASPLVRRLGLEWLHRLVQEPRRLFKRYLVHGIPFAVRLLWSSLWSRRRLAAGAR
jgi:N-acetylglucosaminyldiphosphoundecaprenol N-acetyl-beta-D-mannosaminyltransferase